MGCVTVKLNEEGQKHNKITMFSWCSKCKAVSKSVTMQKDTYCLSFGKYLELRFHGHAYRCRDLKCDESDSTSAKSDTESICTHSLHRDHVQFFSYNGTVASFCYAPVEVWEISLPSLQILLKIHQANDPVALLVDIKHFSARGYEIFATIYDRLAQLLCDVEFPLLSSLKRTLNNDQLLFREKVGVIQALVKEPTVNVYEFDDAVFTMKKTLADSIEAWQQRLADASVQYRAICASAAKSESTNAVASVTPPIQQNTLERKFCKQNLYFHLKHFKKSVALIQIGEPVEGPSVDSGTICTEDFRSEAESPMDISKSNVFLSREVSVDSENSVTQKISTTDAANSSPITNNIIERETKSSTSSDKKSVKTILRELLPSEKTVQPLQSPIPSNEHLSLSIGCVPILVHDQDFSSVIAYCLASNDYKRKLDSLSFCDIHRKSYDATTDTEDASTPAASSSKESEKEKKSKATQTHVEMNFQDLTSATQFTCKVYFARDFDSMRNKLLSVAASLDGNDKTSFYRRQHTSDGDGKSSKDFDRKSSNNSLNTGSDPLKFDDKNDELEKVRAAFIRSLSKSIRWEARGGKSGSKFCKTMGMKVFLVCFHSF